MQHGILFHSAGQIFNKNTHRDRYLIDLLMGCYLSTDQCQLSDPSHADQGISPQDLAIALGALPGISHIPSSTATNECTNKEQWPSGI